MTSLLSTRLQRINLLMPALRSIPNLGCVNTDAHRKRPLALFGAGLLVLMGAVALVMAMASGGSSPATKAGIRFAGVPQQGNVLGDADAKATLMVFADMQCPYCRQFETQAFPSIVDRYVKTGKLKVVFQPISVLGNDSVVASRAVAAAARQNKLFDYASVFYANQEQENSGYVTSGFMTKIAKAVPGLHVAKWKSDLQSGAGSSLLSDAQRAAQTAQIAATPSFRAGRTGARLSPLEVSSLTPDAFSG